MENDTSTTSSYNGVGDIDPLQHIHELYEQDNHKIVIPMKCGDQEVGGVFVEQDLASLHVNVGKI